MRSSSSANRRLRSRPPCGHQLAAVAELIDGAMPDHDGHLLVHVIEEPDDVALGLLPIPRSEHPMSVLAGFTAPDDWAAVGVRARGTAHHLDGDDASESARATFLVHRNGASHSMLRVGDDVTHVAVPVEGTLPDACRRVLGLPTAPAPARSTLLWTAVWLDRGLQALLDPPRGGLGHLRWSDLAALHPAVDPDGPAPATGKKLAALADAHTRAWPWARLRAEPEVVRLPDGPPSRHITEWMDDGFYARWALGAFPSILTLATDVRHALDDHGRTELTRMVAALLA